jgi:hypothetical protein
MSNQRHRPMQVNIQVPPDLDAIYANFALITHSMRASSPPRCTPNSFSGR